MPDVDPRSGNSPGLLIGVVANDGSVYLADIKSKDQAGRNLSVVVPLDTTLSLWVFSPQLRITDALNTDLATFGKGQNIGVSSAERVKQVTLNVASVLPIV